MSENNNNNLGLEGLLQGFTSKSSSSSSNSGLQNSGGQNSATVKEPINTEQVFNNIKDEIKDEIKNEPKESENITITFTLNRKYLSILKKHFENEGIVKQSTFIRAIIIRFMKSSGLI